MSHETAISTLLALAAANPVEAVARARRLLDQNPDPADRVTLLRALGTALQIRGDAARSLDAFQQATAGAVALGDRETIAATTISLAGALTIAGRSGEALAALDALDGHGPLIGRVHFQRGSILARIGRPREAIEAFDVAEPHLLGPADVEVRARLSRNRGMLHLTLLDTEAAQRDLERARRLFTDLEDTYEVGMTEHDLGRLATARGSPAEALEWFDRSEPTIVDIAGSHLDPGRAEALLAAGLYMEAHNEAAQLARRLRAAGMDHAMAEAELLAAEAALLAGRRDEALELAAASRNHFLRQNRPAWEARAMLVELVALEETGSLERSSLDDAVEELSAWGLRSAAVRAEAMAVRAAARAGEEQEAAARLVAARHLFNDLPLDLVIDLRSAEVEVRTVAGDRGGAGRAAAAGLRSLATHAHAAAATDVRSGLARHAQHLARRGLELAIESGDPRRVWTWMEHEKASSLRFRPVRSTADPSTSGLLDELRSITGLIQHADPGHQEELTERQRRLERAIEQHTRVGGVDEQMMPSAALVERTLDRLGDRALVELAAIGTDLWAVFAHRRRVRLIRVGDHAEWADSGYAMGSATRRALSSPHDGERAAAIRNMIDGFAGALRAVLPRHEGPTVVIPTAPLAGLPWGAVLSGGPVAVAPSTTLWLAADSRPDWLGSVASLAGPDLGRVVDEATRVGLIHEGSHIAERPTLAEAVRLFDRSDTIHVAGQGQFRAGQPLFNSVAFHDGDLFVHDLAVLESPPTLVVLSAGESGFTPRSGAEMLETASVLLMAGVRSVVASPWPVPDSSVITTAMVRLHRGLAAGLAPTVALYEAPRPGPEGVVLDAFTCFGA